MYFPVPNGALFVQKWWKLVLELVIEVLKMSLISYVLNADGGQWVVPSLVTPRLYKHDIITS